MSKVLQMQLLHQKLCPLISDYEVVLIKVISNA